MTHTHEHGYVPAPHEVVHPEAREALLSHVTREHGYHGPDAPSTTGHEREANMLAYHRAAHLAAQAPSPPA